VYLQLAINHSKTKRRPLYLKDPVRTAQ